MEQTDISPAGKKVTKKYLLDCISFMERKQSDARIEFERYNGAINFCKMLIEKGEFEEDKKDGNS